MPLSRPLSSRRAIVLAAAPALLAVLLATAAPSFAQDADPPSLVGRIAAVNGQVSMHRADQQDWSEAAPNEPITVGDAVYADQGSVAKIEVGDTELVLMSDSEVDVAALDQDTGRLRLDTGALELRVNALPTEDGLSIVTPRGTVRITRPGSFRIDAGSEDQPTRVTSWDGAAELTDIGQPAPIQPGQALLIAGTPDAPQYSYDNAIGDMPPELRPPPPDVQAQAYVPPDMTGAEDLSQYGEWDQSPDYGSVWYPDTVSPGWEPYRLGRWEFIAPWGWTWIDDQPWGFAPFHYGRWAFIGGRWGWCPGPRERHPVYAPALVAFVGGAGLEGRVGWVPLGPGEFYRPPYRVRDGYLREVNRHMIDRGERQDAGAFANRRFATAVPAGAMGSGSIARAAVALPPAALAHAQVGGDAVAGIQRPARLERPAGHPGPVLPPAETRAAATTRPMLPPARRMESTPIQPRGPIGPALAPAQPPRQMPPAPPPPQRGGSPMPQQAPQFRQPQSQGPQFRQQAPQPEPQSRPQPQPMPQFRQQGPRPEPQVRPQPQPAPQFRQQAPQPAPQFRPQARQQPQFRQPAPQPHPAAPPANAAPHPAPQKAPPKAEPQH